MGGSSDNFPTNGSVEGNSESVETIKSPPFNDMMRLLANDTRLTLISYLRNEPDQPVPLETLAKYIQTNSSADSNSDSKETRRIQRQLYHRHLPKLADCGVIEFYPEIETVRYNPIPAFEALYDRIQTYRNDFY